MKQNWKILLTFGLTAALVPGATRLHAQMSELDQLKTAFQQMQTNMLKMQNRITELEQEKLMFGTNQLGEATGSAVVVRKLYSGEDIGTQTYVITRHNLNDYQEGAPRPRDQTLDPKYHGFIPIPNTPALIKFNAKPRVDLTVDTRNSGNPDRFVPAQIPTRDAPDFGGSARANVN